MSKVITLKDVRIEPHENPVMPSKYVLFLSDNTKEFIYGAARDTEEQRIKQIANAVVNLNFPRREYTLLPVHVELLIRILHGVAAKGRNSVHRRIDMDALGFPLSKDQEANLTFLHYHALAVPDDNAPAGYWLITKRGGAFLRGEIAVPKVSIYQGGNRIGEEGPDVWIHDILREKPEWPSKADFLIPAHQREQVQIGLAI